MNSSEIAFLALGLLLGVALGAAFLVAARIGPAARGEVRVTISPNSIVARRGLTLADPSGFRDHRPLPGSPDEAAWPDRAVAMSAASAAAALKAALPGESTRTRVPSAPLVLPATAVAVAIDRPVGTIGGEFLPADLFRGPDLAASSSSLAGRSVAVAERLAAVAVLDVGASTERPVRPRQTVEPVRPTLAATAVAVAVATAGRPEGGMADPSPSAASTGGLPAVAVNTSADPCAVPRAAMEEICAAATIKRDQSRVAAGVANDARRAYDTLRDQVDRARELSDPRAISAAKAAMREQFRAEDKAAASPDESEAAARRWLQSINQANNDVLAALRVVETGTVEMRERLADVERLAREADAARISAEGADETCRIAREDLARCEEHVLANTPAPIPDEPHPFDGAWPTHQDLTSPGGPRDVPDDALAGQSAILRIVRGDRAARDRVVTAIAGSDATAIASWQIRVTALSDAIVARAIEAGYLVLADDHPFWGLFSNVEQRAIVEALASLGFRFDGLGGFADGRVPTARDLSLAVGYAGLDRMRIRVWPREPEIVALYAQAEVAADDWLVWVAGDLGLASLTGALGSRAAALSVIWDAWGRVRPALVATD